MKTVEQDRLRQIYERIGREEGLRRILHAFYERMSADTMIGFFFADKDLHAIADKQKAFLMRAMGAVPSYSGKAPAQAHTHLAPILPGFFDRRLRILESVLKDHQVSDEDIKSWVQFENSFRSGIEKKERLS